MREQSHQGTAHKPVDERFHVEKRKRRPRPNTALISEACARKTSDLASLLSFQLKAARIEHLREQVLIEGRKYRTDIVVGNLAIEVDGATWIGGRHARGYGIETDCEKQNLLVALGYRPMRFTAKQVRDGRALRWIEQARTA